MVSLLIITARKILVKLTPVVNFINIVWAAFAPIQGAQAKMAKQFEGL